MRGSERLKEIKEQFEELLDEAKKIVRASGTNHDYERAKAYWINPIQCALESQGMGQGSMEETIASLDDDEEVEQPQTDEEIIETLQEIADEVDGTVRQGMCWYRLS